MTTLASRPSVHNGFFIATELETIVDSAYGLVHVGVADQHGDANLGGANQFDVDTYIAQSLAEVGGYAGVGLHARADQGHLAHVIVEDEVLPVVLLLDSLQQLHRAGCIRAWAGEGDVGAVVVDLADVLHDHIDVDFRISDGTENLRRFPRGVRDTEDGDLSFGAVVGHAGEYCFFHGNILH